MKTNSDRAPTDAHRRGARRTASIGYACGRNLANRAVRGPGSFQSHNAAKRCSWRHPEARFGALRESRAYRQPT